VECRASEGACDVAEYCTGINEECPSDAVQAENFECRAADGICDVAEVCDGTSKGCPENTFKDSEVMCRESAGDCDVAEYCTGTGPSCPADGFQASTVVCRAAGGACDIEETCTGSSAECPSDEIQAAGAVCREKVSGCDVAEFCDGNDKACPEDFVYEYGYTYKCATDQFLCGISADELIGDAKGKHKVVYSIGDSDQIDSKNVCVLGTATSVFEVHAADEQSISTTDNCQNNSLDANGYFRPSNGAAPFEASTICPNGHQISNFVALQCKPIVGDTENANWTCCGKCEVNNNNDFVCNESGLAGCPALGGVSRRRFLRA